MLPYPCSDLAAYAAGKCVFMQYQYAPRSFDGSKYGIMIQRQ